MKNSSRARSVRGALLIVGAGISCALYAQSVNLQPGNYEFVYTTQMDIPAEMAARLPPGFADKMAQPHTQQRCISDSDLAKVSQRLSSDGSQDDSSCQMSNQSVSGNQVSFVMHCTHRTATFNGTFTSTAFTATVVSTTDQGKKMTVNINARRSGDCSK
jgi:Protein of unknown function (DUF3617)